MDDTLHGERRRDVTKLITNNQTKDLFAHIARQDREVLAEKAIDNACRKQESAQAEYQHYTGRLKDAAGIC